MTQIDPLPKTSRYQPRADASVFLERANIKPQPDHPPEVLARIVRVPDGAASECSLLSVFNGATADEKGARIHAVRVERRKLAAEARARTREAAKASRLANYTPRSETATALALAVMMATEKPLTLQEVRARMSVEVAPKTVQSALKEMAQRGKTQTRVIIQAGRAGLCAEHWRADKPWPAMDSYRPGARIHRAVK